MRVSPRVAVFGATGFVGRHLIDTLLARGDRVTALVRTPGDPTARPVYFILLAWDGDKIAGIRDFRFARYAIDGLEFALDQDFAIRAMHAGDAELQGIRLWVRVGHFQFLVQIVEAVAPNNGLVNAISRAPDARHPVARAIAQPADAG